VNEVEDRKLCILEKHIASGPMKAVAVMIESRNDERGVCS